VPHGVSNALMLGPVLGHNMEAARPLYAELGTLLDRGLEGQGSQAQAHGFVAAMDSICRRAGVPMRLRDVGVTQADLDLLAAEAMKQERLLVNNPCPITQADARRLYEAAL
jgi:alcohol dehydrogenase class IV